MAVGLSYPLHKDRDSGCQSSLCCSGEAFRCARTWRIPCNEHFALSAKCAVFPLTSTQRVDSIHAFVARARRRGVAVVRFQRALASTCLAGGANASNHSMGTLRSWPAGCVALSQGQRHWTLIGPLLLGRGLAVCKGAKHSMESAPAPGQRVISPFS